MIEKKRIVVVGGGTGTYTLLRGLKQYHDDLEITAVVTMADSGGSTGRLRDEFGYLPIGDARMALVALAADVNSHDELMRELFLYRFSKGNGLSGHNFGNLLLTALTDMLGNEAKAIETASRILRVRGQVIPVTMDNVQLVATYSDGEERIGEDLIDEPDSTRHNTTITNLYLKPRADINPHAKLALEQADMIIFGPGDLYTSIIANCVVGGFKEAMQSSRAQKLFVSNLMTKVGQTAGMTAFDHLQTIENYSGCIIDKLLMHDTNFPEQLLEKYAQESEYPVELGTNARNIPVVKADICSQEEIKLQTGDVVRRSLIRHDSTKLAKIVYEQLFK